MNQSQSLPVIRKQFSVPELYDADQFKMLHLIRFKRTSAELWAAIKRDAEEHDLRYIALYGKFQHDDGSNGRRLPHMSLDASLAMPAISYWRNVPEAQLPKGVACRLVCDSETRERIREISDRLQRSGQWRIQDRFEETFTVLPQRMQ